VGLGDRARDEQPEPCARTARAALGAAELLEDDAVLLSRDARPPVANADEHAPVRRRHVHVDVLSALRPLHSILDQVRENLTQPHAVAAHVRERPVHDGADLHLVLPESRRSDGILGELADVQVVEPVGERARSMRDVSRTSAMRSASRLVSSAISARNEARCSGESSRQRC
jgi:hypothetical protein